MPTKSTSIHSINADKGLNRPQKALYLALNWLNNTPLPHGSVDPKLQQRLFTVDDPGALINRLDIPKASPSRTLCDMFWMTLPWAEITTELGDIHMFDSGCGSGGYAESFQQWSGDLVKRYVGFDIAEHPRWETLARQHPEFSFFAADSKQIGAHIPPETNLLVSQSAIEHFQEDLTYFRQVRDFVQAQQRPILQFHLLPSAPTLRLYRFHGVRQFTPHTLSKITRLFSDFSDVTLYALGGKASNAVHYEYVTVPRVTRRGDDRETRTDAYVAAKTEAIIADMQADTGEPSFYALIIHSRPQRHLFDDSTLFRTQ